MEFVEAPPFTRFLKDYLSDDQYLAMQRLLTLNPALGISCQTRVVFVSYAGPTSGGAKAAGAAYELFITIFRQIIKFG